MNQTLICRYKYSSFTLRRPVLSGAGSRPTDGRIGTGEVLLGFRVHGRREVFDLSPTLDGVEEGFGGLNL